MDDKIKKKVLKKHTKGTFGSIVATAANVRKPEIKLPEIKKPNVKIPPVKDLFTKKAADEPGPEPNELHVTSISTRSALKIIYYLMTVDGQLLPSELDQFDLIGREIAPEYQNMKDELVKECRTQLERVIDTEDHFEVVREGVEDALQHSIKTEVSFITPKLLIWDLLTIAYSDESYHETERKLIKYIVRKLDIDKAVYMEMESTILTILDLEKEQEWLNNTDRPYRVIEAQVNEIEDRKHVIFESVKDLIAL